MKVRPTTKLKVLRAAVRRTAPAGWALLAEHIGCELSKARQSKRKAERACAKEAVDYWAGNIAALDNLRKAFATELKVKPNFAAERPHTHIPKS